MSLKIHYMQPSGSSEFVTAEEIAKEVFGRCIKKSNQERTIKEIEKLGSGYLIQLFPEHKRIHLKISGKEFDKDELEAFKYAKKTWNYIGNKTRPKLSRLDIKYENPGCSPMDIIQDTKHTTLEFFGKFGKNKSIKPSIIGYPIETFYINGKDFTIRIYSKISEVRTRIKRKMFVSDWDLEVLGKFGSTDYTITEFELKGQTLEYCNILFPLIGETKEELDKFKQSVLNRFLRQNPWRISKTKMHPLWKELMNDTDIQIQRPKKRMNSRNKEEDLRFMEKVLKNKAKSWNLSKEEKTKLVLRFLGITRDVDFWEIGEKSYSEYLLEDANRKILAAQDEARAVGKSDLAVAVGDEDAMAMHPTREIKKAG